MDNRFVLALMVLLSLVGLELCEKVVAGPECKLPLNLPKINRINASMKDSEVDFEIQLESDPMVKIERDSLRWHASWENHYMLLPVIDGVNDASVVHYLDQSDPESKIVLKSYLKAPRVKNLTYSLLLKLKLPCTTIHMAIHQPAGDVNLPIETGRIESMPPPEIFNPDGPVQVEYVIITSEVNNSTDSGLLMGPLTVPKLTRLNQPWQGGWVLADSRKIFKNGSWTEITTATIEPEEANALYEYYTNHAYAGGRVGITFILPLLVIQTSTSPQIGFLTCYPSQKLSAEKINGEIILSQAYHEASCIKFDFFNVKNAVISMRKKSCKSRRPGQRIQSVFGDESNYTTNYAEQTYYLEAAGTMQYPHTEVCYQLRAVNKLGGKLMNFRVKIYQPTNIRVNVMVTPRFNNRGNEVHSVELGCKGENWEEKMYPNIYVGRLEDYGTAHRLVQDGIKAETQWTDLRDTGLLDENLLLTYPPLPIGLIWKTYWIRPDQIVSMLNDQQSIFCTIRTKYEYLVEKFNFTDEHLNLFRELMNENSTHLFQ